MQSALWGEIRICHNKALAHGVRADSLQQEALSRSIPANEEAEACSAVGDEREVGEQGLNFELAPHGDVGQAYARHDAAFERVKDDGGHAFGDAGRGGDLVSHGQGIPPRLRDNPR